MSSGSLWQPLISWRAKLNRKHYSSAMVGTSALPWMAPTGRTMHGGLGPARGGLLSASTACGTARDPSVRTTFSASNRGPRPDASDSLRPDRVRIGPVRPARRGRIGPDTKRSQFRRKCAFGSRLRRVRRPRAGADRRPPDSGPPDLRLIGGRLRPFPTQSGVPNPPDVPFRRPKTAANGRGHEPNPRRGRGLPEVEAGRGGRRRRRA
jgi:hypothetical protein